METDVDLLCWSVNKEFLVKRYASIDVKAVFLGASDIRGRS